MYSATAESLPYACACPWTSGILCSGPLSSVPFAGWFLRGILAHSQLLEHRFYNSKYKLPHVMTGTLASVTKLTNIQHHAPDSPSYLSQKGLWERACMSCTSLSISCRALVTFSWLSGTYVQHSTDRMPSWATVNKSNVILFYRTALHICVISSIIRVRACRVWFKALAYALLRL